MEKYKKLLLPVGALVLALAIGAGVVTFFSKKDPAAQSVSQYYIHDEESFQAVAKSFHRIPFNDPQMEFDLLLPKDWTTEQTIQSDASSNLSQKILGEVARFKSPYIGTNRATVTVQSVKLDREITAEQWLKNYMLVNGYDLDGKIDAPTEKKANAYYTSSSEGESSYSYITAQINANNLILTRFETPSYMKKYLEFLRKRVIDSFKFILASDLLIETQKNVIFPEALRLSYPVSWQSSDPDAEDIDHITLTLHNKDRLDHTNGLIRVIAARRTASSTLRKEADTLKAYFENTLGLEFKKLVSSDKMVAPERFLFSRHEVYQLVSKKNAFISQDVHLVVLGDKNWYIFAFLLTPKEADNFYTWASNTQAFNVVVRSIR